MGDFPLRPGLEGVLDRVVGEGVGHEGEEVVGLGRLAGRGLREGLEEARGVPGEKWVNIFSLRVPGAVRDALLDQPQPGGVLAQARDVLQDLRD